MTSRTAYNRAYYLANRARLLEQQKTYNVSHREEIADRKRAYNLAHKDERAEQLWRRMLVREYSLSDFDFMRRLEQQRYACARCHRSFREKTPHVDHDHDTGKVRGLLCASCNVRVRSTAQDALLTARYLGMHE